MIETIEKSFLKVYQNFGAYHNPVICQVNSIEELLKRLFLRDSHSVLFQPWPYCTSYSRPVSFEDGSESRVLKEQFQSYNKLYAFDSSHKTNSDILFESIYEDYENEIDAIQDTAVTEFPEFALDVEEYIFLGDFGWVSSEVLFFDEMSELGMELSSKDRQFIGLLKEIMKYGIFSVTLPDLILYYSTKEEKNKFV